MHDDNTMVHCILTWYLNTNSTIQCWRHWYSINTSCSRQSQRVKISTRPVQKSYSWLRLQTCIRDFRCESERLWILTLYCLGRCQAVGGGRQVISRLQEQTQLIIIQKISNQSEIFVTPESSCNGVNLRYWFTLSNFVWINIGIKFYSWCLWKLQGTKNTKYTQYLSFSKGLGSCIQGC